MLSGEIALKNNNLKHEQSQTFGNALQLKKHDKLTNDYINNIINY